MLSRYARFLIPFLYTALMIFSPLAHAQTRPSAPLVTVYKTPT